VFPRRVFVRWIHSEGQNFLRRFAPKDGQRPPEGGRQRECMAAEGCQARVRCQTTFSCPSPGPAGATSGRPTNGHARRLEAWRPVRGCSPHPSNTVATDCCRHGGPGGASTGASPSSAHTHTSTVRIVQATACLVAVPSESFLSCKHQSFDAHTAPPQAADQAEISRLREQLNDALARIVRCTAHANERHCIIHTVDCCLVVSPHTPARHCPPASG
jgi:hypothetical protein